MGLLSRIGISHPPEGERGLVAADPKSFTSARPRARARAITTLGRTGPLATFVNLESPSSRRRVPTPRGDGDLDCVGAARPDVTVPPPGEYLTAFAISWSSTCRSLSGSALAWPGLPSTSATNRCPFPFVAAASTTLWTTSTTSVGSSITVRSPLSRRAALSSASTIMVSPSDSRAMNSRNVRRSSSENPTSSRRSVCANP